MNILRALALGAKELSGFDRLPSAPPPSSSSSSTRISSPVLSKNTLARPTSSAPAVPKPTLDSITNNILEARTRRFSQKSHIEASRPVPKANAFSNLAPVFLGGLLGRWGGNRGAGIERGFDVIQKAHVMVLKRFVLTIGVLVYYAGKESTQ